MFRKFKGTVIFFAVFEILLQEVLGRQECFDFLSFKMRCGRCHQFSERGIILAVRTRRSVTEQI